MSYFTMKQYVSRGLNTLLSIVYFSMWDDRVVILVLLLYQIHVVCFRNRNRPKYKPFLFSVLLCHPCTSNINKQI